MIQWLTIKNSHLSPPSGKIMQATRVTDIILYYNIV